MNSYEVKTANDIADTLETYSNDIDACIQRGLYRGKFKLVEIGRRDEQRRLAKEIREQIAESKPTEPIGYLHYQQKYHDGFPLIPIYEFSTLQLTNGDRKAGWLEIAVYK